MMISIIVIRLENLFISYVINTIKIVHSVMNMNMYRSAVIMPSWFVLTCAIKR